MMWVQSSNKLSPQDKKDLEKFTKYFVYKCVQVIVGSRLGERAKSHSKAVSSGADWFNLSIKDVPEVQNETKKALVSHKAVLSDKCICIEISLKTPENDVMMLESWWIGVDEHSDPNVRVSYTVYNRMGILLKSLLCVTRVTPAYRLSRKQCVDSHVICYRIYVGEPHVMSLGERSQMRKVGMVPTPAGTVYVKVAYRTKMLLSPKCSIRDLSVDLKDDHFQAESSPKKTADSKKRLATEDAGCNEENLNDSYTTIQAGYQNGHHPSTSNGKSHLTREKLNVNKDDTKRSFSDCQKTGAFASNRQSTNKSEEDIPFISLLNVHDKDHKEQLQELVHNGNYNLNGIEPACDNMTQSGGSESGKSTTSHASAPEDFVMIELKTPFAAANSESDLGRFYRDCQGAPPLAMFESQTETQQSVTDITTQLAEFEANLDEFDDFVESLHPSK